MQTDDDLVERLRRNSEWRNHLWQCVTDPALLIEAATRISELEAEIARLRAGAGDQEPVAWMHEHPEYPADFERHRYGAGRLTEGDKAAGWTETPLYSHPPATTTAEDLENLVEGLSFRAWLAWADSQ